MSECTPTEARLRERVKGSLGEYAHEFEIDGEAAMDEWIDQALAERDNQVRADERAKLQDRIEELEKNLSYEVEQKIKLADTLRDERAKRPDREQIERTVRAHRVWWNFETGSLCQCGWKCLLSEHPAHVADAVLALEPEAREDKLEHLAAVTNINLITKAMLEEVGYPSHFHPADAPSWAYSVLEEEHEARTAPEAREEHRPVDIEPSDTVCAKCSRRQGDGTYAETVEWPCALAEAREEAELFHDQDGDLWKLTDKGEWFHEEEPGEFRQVLSIDAEDQTLTPVGHAELAPDAEVAREAE